MKTGAKQNDKLPRKGEEGGHVQTHPRTTAAKMEETACDNLVWDSFFHNDASVGKSALDILLAVRNSNSIGVNRAISRPINVNSLMPN